LANRHREALKGIAFMEAIVALQSRDYSDKMGMRPALEALRSGAGEAMVLQNNYFIEEILPNAILRKLSDQEMAEYRRPFEGEPVDMHAIATEYADWLGTSNVPKLFLKVEPGAIIANLPGRNGPPPPSLSVGAGHARARFAASKLRTQTSKNSGKSFRRCPPHAEVPPALRNTARCRFPTVHAHGQSA
jgi:hypothetical protein